MLLINIMAIHFVGAIHELPLQQNNESSPHNNELPLQNKTKRIKRMAYNPDKHHRRSIRLKYYDYSQHGAYFITICVKNRECLFGKIINDKMQLNEYGEIAKQYWLDISTHFPYAKLDEFIVMPNHIHGIIYITERNDVFVWAIHELPIQQKRRKMLLPKIIGYFKMNVAKQINQLRQMLGMPLWQRNYYEHVIRNDLELNRIRQYIINNPLNWQLDEYYESS